MAMDDRATRQAAAGVIGIAAKEETVRLYLMQLGLLTDGGTPFPGYLIQTDDGTNVLVDTGWPRSMIGAYRDPVGAIPDIPSDDEAVRQTVAVARRTRIEEDDFVINRLAALGLAPRDIDLLICTHLDPDHAGNHDLFPDAELVIQRRQYQIAREYQRFTMMGAPWDVPGLRYRQVEGDTQLLPGIELIESSGHVPGHQAVLVRLPETGPVLLAIDAIGWHGQLVPGAAMRVFDMDEAQTRNTIRTLTERAEREGVRLLVFGHDSEQWPTLRKSPDFYE